MTQHEAPPRYSELAKTVFAAIGDRHQNALAEKCGIDPGDLSRLLTGEKCPALWALANLATELEIDLPEMLLLKEIADTSHNGDSAKRDEHRAGWKDVNGAFAKLLANHRQRSQRKKRPNDGLLSLCDWPFGFNVQTILVGDRRESPPHTAADVLAKAASTADLMYLTDLHLEHQEQSPRIRSDKIVRLASPDGLRSQLNSDLLVVGSPAANLGSRALNEGACFRFAVDPDVQAIERELDGELEPIKYDRDALEEFVDPIQHPERMQRLHHMLEGFAKPGFIDPIDAVGLRGVAVKSWNDFGVVTLCRNPWAPDRIAVMLAGIKGPATAAALKLLGTPDAFKDHPLGGVFVVKIPTEANWENRYDLLKPKWDTRPYTVEKYLQDVKKLSAAGHFSRADIQNLDELVEVLQKRSNPL